MVQRMLTSDQHQGDRPRQAWEAGDLEPGVAEMQATLRLYVDFPEAHQALGMATPTSGVLTTPSFTYDGDEWPDGLMANDLTPGLLFANNGDGTFRWSIPIRRIYITVAGMERWF